MRVRAYFTDAGRAVWQVYHWRDIMGGHFHVDPWDDKLRPDVRGFRHTRTGEWRVYHFKPGESLTMHPRRVAEQLAQAQPPETVPTIRGEPAG